MTDPVVLFFAGLVGLALGSFLNVCVARWPRGAAVTRPRSACPACSTGIRWYDQVPVASRVVLGARCRACRARISLSYPLVEGAGAAICVVMVLTRGLSLEAAAGGFFLLVLLGIALTDARSYLIPDQLSLGGAAVGLALSLAPGGITPGSAALGVVVGFGGMWLVGEAGTRILLRANPLRVETATREHDLGRRRVRDARVVRVLARPRGQLAALLPAVPVAVLAGREFGPVGAAAAVGGWAAALAVLVAWVEGLGAGAAGVRASANVAHPPSAPAVAAAQAGTPTNAPASAETRASVETRACAATRASAEARAATETRASTDADPEAVLGGGDVKMMALVGAFTGPWGAVLTVFLGALAGVLAYYVLRLLLGIRQLVPFGVFLAAGATIALWRGEALLAWYLALTGLTAP